MKILIAAIVAGILVFGWGAVSHMVLPIRGGLVEMKDLGTEQAVLDGLKSRLHEPGVYLLPQVGFESKDEAEQKAYAERYRQGPNAFLVYHPDGKELKMLPLLGIELLSNVAAAFVAALVVTRLRAAFPTRVFVVMLMGLFAWLSIEVSYWNWYRFPDAYSLAQAIDQIGGWLLGGIAIGWMVKGKE